MHILAQTNSMTPWTVMVVAVLGALGTLALHLFLFVSKSVTDSQVPRLEMLRKIVEDTNEAFFNIRSTGQAIVRMRKKIIRGEGDDPDIVNDGQYARECRRSASKLFTSAIGYSYALGHPGLADQITDAHDWVVATALKVKDASTLEDLEKLREVLNAGVHQRWMDIACRLDHHLREEARLKTAFQRYFGS